jgi:hypothetical protein
LIFKSVPVGQGTSELYHAWFDGAALGSASRLTTDALAEDEARAGLDASGALRLIWTAGTTVQSTTQEVFVAEVVFECQPANYCTAGTSASGCQAVLSSTGTPSATAATGFVVTAGGVEGVKDGLFFYGTNGAQANSWGNGTSYQCVVPPTKRSPALNSGGTLGACDGAMSRDMNTYWTAFPPKNPGVGASVHLQLWYRDPLSTSNQTTSLSDGLSFLLCP